MKFNALTGLRGFCALVVALSHLSVVGWVVQSDFVQNSYLLVDFFFVLSGFVIAYAYMDRLRSRANGVGFVIRRFGRLYPVHLTVLAVMVFTELTRFAASHFYALAEQKPFTLGTSLPTLASNLLLAQSLGFNAAPSWNFPSWSISVEFYTYLLFALIALLTLSLKAGVRVLIFALIMAGGAAVPILYSETGMFVMSDYGFYRCIFGFFAGVLTFVAYRRSRGPGLEARPASLQTRRLASLAEILCVIMAISFIVIADYSALSFAAPLIFAICIFVFADEMGPISALLTSAPMRYLGDRSYSIYMVHSFIAIEVIHRSVSVLERLTHWNLMDEHVNELGELTKLIDFGNPLYGDALTLVFIVLTILVANISYQRVEEPWRAWFNALADRVEARLTRRLNRGSPEIATTDGQLSL